MRRLIGNLRGASVPLTLLSHFARRPAQDSPRRLPTDPEAIVQQQVRDVLAIYDAAVRRER